MKTIKGLDANMGRRVEHTTLKLCTQKMKKLAGKNYIVHIMINGFQTGPNGAGLNWNVEV